MTALLAPPAPSWRAFVTDWELDPLLIVALAAAVLYIVGVRRLARRGRRWPPGRVITFFAGLAAIVVATQSGLAAYDRVLFSLHVVQHLLLGMVAPLLLALGAPVTLALQAGARGTQRRLLRVLRSPPVAVLSHPVTAWLLFGGSLVALYFSPLYEASLRHEWLHALVHAHFVLVGCVFCWNVVGLDPLPHALGYGGRLLYVVVALPFHAFLGVALLTSNHVIASSWYAGIVRDWGASPLADQRTGAGVLWIAGEIFGLVAAGVALYRWMGAEERAGSRHDRLVDAPINGGTTRLDSLGRSGTGDR
jgi:putative membrane protein